MALIAGPAWALVSCLLGQAVMVSAGDRTEIRTRVQSSALRFDAETRPTVRLALVEPRSSYSFGYIPTLTLLGFGADDDLILQQAADASARFSWQHTTFSVSQSGSYGTRNFRALSVAQQTPTGSTAGTTPGGTTGTPPGGTGTTPPGTMPPTPTPPGQTTTLPNSQFQLIDQNITLFASQTTASLQQAFSSRTFGTVTAGYEYGGGIDAASQLFLPIRKGPTVTLSVRERATPADDLTTVTDGSYLETGTTMRAQIADLGEQWTHRWSPAVVASLLAGASVAHAESDGFPQRRISAIVPIGTLSAAYGFGLSGGHMTTSSFVQFAPIIDRFTGDFDQRITWVLDANWTRYQWSLIGNISGAQSVLPRVVFSNPFVLPFNYYSASASALYRLTRQIAVESGLRAAWVRTEGPDPYPLLWSAFAAGSYTMSATYW